MDGFLNPNEILNQLGLKGNMTAADFGSGSGGWALPLAKQLKDGKVYAVDVLGEALSALKNKAESQKITNIEAIRVNLESEKGVPQIASNSCDLVLMTNLLFQSEKKEGILEEAKRVLKQGGRILVVDWMPDAVLGPSEGRVSLEEAKDMAQKADFKIEADFQAGLYHWALILVK
ncbi:MAG: class I SAM-dependent methyltransferase [Candidatus Nealsonbacteria bacterium]|nr:class I SAM-dependent methyltransferase [Candidatus Nealsonbacteria bacterium]